MKVLFALGSNGSGQLGIGHKEDVSVPKQVLFPEDLSILPTIRKIAAGGNHTLLLTEPGELFWSGDSTTGACGKVTSEQKAAEPQFTGSMFPAWKRGFRGKIDSGDVGDIDNCLHRREWEGHSCLHLAWA